MTANGNAALPPTASTGRPWRTQVQQIEQQMVSLANTSLSGRYIFAGDTDQTAPYTYDVTQTDPVEKRKIKGSVQWRMAAI